MQSVSQMRYMRVGALSQQNIYLTMYMNVMTPFIISKTLIITVGLNCDMVCPCLKHITHILLPRSARLRFGTTNILRLGATNILGLGAKNILGLVSTRVLLPHVFITSPAQVTIDVIKSNVTAAVTSSILIDADADNKYCVTI